MFVSFDVIMYQIQSKKLWETKSWADDSRKKWSNLPDRDGGSDRFPSEERWVTPLLLESSNALSSSSKRLVSVTRHRRVYGLLKRRVYSPRLTQTVFIGISRWQRLIETWWTSFPTCTTFICKMASRLSERPWVGPKKRGRRSVPMHAAAYPYRPGQHWHLFKGPC